VATPLDDPTLHLTVGVSNPTGADLLSWYVEKLRASEDIRRDLPLFARPADQSEYVTRIQEAFAGGWTPDLLNEYFADLDAKAQARPRFSLPWTASPDVLPAESEAFSVQWNGARRVHLNEQDGEIHLIAQGRRWRFAAGARPMLERLISGSPCTMMELASLSDTATARAFVRDLVVNGLVSVVGA
jgi:hypothetical protein